MLKTKHHQLLWHFKDYWLLSGTDKQRVGVTNLRHACAGKGTQVRFTLSVLREIGPPYTSVFSYTRTNFCVTFPYFKCGYQPDKPLRGCQGAVNSLLKRLLPVAYEDGELFKVSKYYFLLEIKALHRENNNFYSKSVLTFFRK